MKNRIIFWGFLVLVFSIVTNCTGKKVVLEEKISKEKVKIVKTYYKDMYLLAIPIGFHLEFDRKKTISGSFYFIHNNEYRTGTNDFTIFDNLTGNKFYGFDKKTRETFPEDGYFVNREFILDKKTTLKLLYFHKIDTTRINELQSIEDSIALTTYDKFRIDTPSFLEKMREKPDTIQLLLNLTNGKQKEVKMPIKW